MIPKKIHYCWFGGKELPKSAKKCIKSWKKFFPDYEIVEWNESNYDVSKIKYIREAYEAKKYAFVSDYARTEIIHREGGVYFDTDVEVIKDMTPIINNGPYAGMENEEYVNLGLGFAAEANNPICKKLLDSYRDESFIYADKSLNLKTIVTRLTEILKKHGLKKTVNEKQLIEGITIYPEEYFCPISTKDGKLRITPNTYTIHHFDQSWQPYSRKIGRKIALLLGGERFKIFIKNIFKFK